MEGLRRSRNARVLCLLGGTFTLFLGFSYRGNGILGEGALLTGFTVMGIVVMLQMMPRQHMVLSLLLIAISAGYWANLLLFLGGRWGMIYGLSGPVYSLAGGLLGLIAGLRRRVEILPSSE